MNNRVTITMDNGIADVRLNRPDKLNALDPAMFDAILATGEALSVAKGLRAVLLSGEGRGFCGGLDLSSFSDIGAVAGDLEARTHGLSNRLQHAAMLWRTLPVPVIAAVHGVCFGGGLQIALGADIRIASADARFSVMEMKWGLVPDMGGFVLTRGLVRDDVMRELTYSAREVGAVEAQAIGLVTRLSDRPFDDARALAAEIASRNPQAIRAAKRLFAIARDKDAGATLLAESREQAAILGSPNQREAVLASLQNRPPDFSDQS